MQWSVSVLLTIRQFRSPTSFIINLQHGQEIRAEEKSLSMSRHERPHWTGTLITNRRRTHLKHSIHLSIPVHLTGQKKKKIPQDTSSITSIIFMIQATLNLPIQYIGQHLGFKKKKKKESHLLARNPLQYCSSWSFKSSDSKVKFKKRSRRRKLCKVPFTENIFFFIMVMSADLHFSSLKQGKPVHIALNKGIWPELNRAFHLGSNQFYMFHP